MSKKTCWRRQEVTSATAKKWLEQNVENNRRVNKRRVSRYAADMKAGRWGDCGDPIRFDEDGKLIDGQHRLHAIAESGVTLTLFVLTGIPRDGFRHIDQGYLRQTKDFIDPKNNTTRVALARNFLAYSRSGGTSVMNALSSRAEELAFIDRNDASLAESAAAIRGRRCRFLSPSVGAFCHFVLKKKDADAASEFFDKLISGENLSGPIHVLRERLQDQTRANRLTKQQETYLIFRTWNAWRTKERLSKLQFPKGGDVPGAPIDLTSVEPK